MTDDGEERAGSAVSLEPAGTGRKRGRRRRLQSMADEDPQGYVRTGRRIEADVAPTGGRPASIRDLAAVEAERAPVERISLSLPDYLANELKIDALRRRRSVRTHFLTILREAGYEIADADMEDLRGIVMKRQRKD